MLGAPRRRFAPPRRTISPARASPISRGANHFRGCSRSQQSAANTDMQPRLPHPRPHLREAVQLRARAKLSQQSWRRGQAEKSRSARLLNLPLLSAARCRHTSALHVAAVAQRLTRAARAVGGSSRGALCGPIWRETKQLPHSTLEPEEQSASWKSSRSSGRCALRASALAAEPAHTNGLEGRSE